MKTPSVTVIEIEREEETERDRKRGSKEARHLGC